MTVDCREPLQDGAGVATNLSPLVNQFNPDDKAVVLNFLTALSSNSGTALSHNDQQALVYRLISVIDKQKTDKLVEKNSSETCSVLHPEVDELISLPDDQKSGTVGEELLESSRPEPGVYESVVGMSQTVEGTDLQTGNFCLPAAITETSMAETKATETDRTDVALTEHETLSSQSKTLDNPSVLETNSSEHKSEVISRICIFNSPNKTPQTIQDLRNHDVISTCNINNCSDEVTENTNCSAASETPAEFEVEHKTETCSKESNNHDGSSRQTSCDQERELCSDESEADLQQVCIIDICSEDETEVEPRLFIVEDSEPCSPQSDQVISEQDMKDNCQENETPHESNTLQNVESEYLISNSDIDATVKFSAAEDIKQLAITIHHDSNLQSIDSTYEMKVNNPTETRVNFDSEMDGKDQNKWTPVYTSFNSRPFTYPSSSEPVSIDRSSSAIRISDAAFSTGIASVCSSEEARKGSDWSLAYTSFSYLSPHSSTEQSAYLSDTPDDIGNETNKARGDAEDKLFQTLCNKKRDEDKMSLKCTDFTDRESQASVNPEPPPTKQLHASLLGESSIKPLPAPPKPPEYLLKKDMIPGLDLTEPPPMSPTFFGGTLHYGHKSALLDDYSSRHSGVATESLKAKSNLFSLVEHSESELILSPDMQQQTERNNCFEGIDNSGLLCISDHEDHDWRIAPPTLEHKYHNPMSEAGAAHVNEGWNPEFIHRDREDDRSLNDPYNKQDEQFGRFDYGAPERIDRFSYDRHSECNSERQEYQRNDYNRSEVFLRSDPSILRSEERCSPGLVEFPQRSVFDRNFENEKITRMLPVDNLPSNGANLKRFGRFSSDVPRDDFEKYQIKPNLEMMADSDWAPNSRDRFSSLGNSRFLERGKNCFEPNMMLQPFLNQRRIEERGIRSNYLEENQVDQNHHPLGRGQAAFKRLLPFCPSPRSFAMASRDRLSPALTALEYRGAQHPRDMPTASLPEYRGGQYKDDSVPASNRGAQLRPGSVAPASRRNSQRQVELIPTSNRGDQHQADIGSASMPEHRVGHRQGDVRFGEDQRRYGSRGGSRREPYRTENRRNVDKESLTTWPDPRYDATLYSKDRMYKSAERDIVSKERPKLDDHDSDKYTTKEKEASSTVGEKTSKGKQNVSNTSLRNSSMKLENEKHIVETVVKPCELQCNDTNCTNNEEDNKDELEEGEIVEVADSCEEDSLERKDKADEPSYITDRKPPLLSSEPYRVGKRYGSIDLLDSRESRGSKDIFRRKNSDTIRDGFPSTSSRSSPSHKGYTCDRHQTREPASHFRQKSREPPLQFNVPDHLSQKFDGLNYSDFPTHLYRHRGTGYQRGYPKRR